MYHFSKDLKQTQFFFFEKHLFSDMNWAMLSKASKAIYPIIRAFCGPKGESFPGEETIAMQSGRTEKIVRSGIRGLKGFPGIRFESYTSKRGRSTKRFFCKIPQYEKGKVFPFHRDILEGGNWAMLKPTAQALYPVMRFFGYIDNYEDYCISAYEEMGEETSWIDFDYKNRNFDFCEAEPGTLCKYAGISRRSYAEAIKDLEKHFFITRKPDETWKFMVYLHPPKYYKREFMHKEAIKRRVETENPGQEPGKPDIRTKLKEDEKFNAFWELYPKKAGKEDAIKVWNDLAPSWDMVEQIIESLFKERKAWIGKGRTTPYASTWLKEKKWESEGAQAQGDESG